MLDSGSQSEARMGYQLVGNDVCVINGSVKAVTVKTCAVKSCEKCSFASQNISSVVMFYNQQRDHCGNILVIFNIFWEQKHSWQVWLLRGSVSLWPVVYLWTGRANVRSEVLLDLGQWPWWQSKLTSFDPILSPYFCKKACISVFQIVLNS